MNRIEPKPYHGGGPPQSSGADLLSPENLAKVIQAKRVNLEVGAGLNYVRPRAKPYYCYRRFKKRMGQRKEGEGLSEEGDSFSGGEGSSGQLSLTMQSESGELPSMLTPQEREQTERRRSSRTQPQPIWTPEVHLYLWERARVYIESYRRNVTVTIHPAILDEENIKQLLYNEDDTRDCTPLSLNIFLAISLGAHAEGEKQTWLEFWMKSRNELSSLFDETDYNVAVALFLMGCHTFFANNEREKAMYYVLLSQSICRRMGYLNSDPYLRGLAFLTFQARKKPLTVKALRKFQERMVEMNAQPYYYIPLHGNPKLEKLTNDIVEQAPTGHPTEYLDFQDFMFQSLHNIMAKVLFNVATGFALTKLKLQQRFQKDQQQIQQYLNNNNNDSHSEGESGKDNDVNTEAERNKQQNVDALNDDFNQAFTEELIQKLQELNNEVDQKGSNYKGPYLVWVKSFSASLIVDVLWNLGDTKRALDMAMVYLRMAETQPFQRTISSVPVLCLPILNVFLATQNFSLLEELLRALAPLKTRFQPLEALLAPFEERLEIHSQEQNMYDLLNMKDEDGLLSLFPSPTTTTDTSPTSSLSVLGGATTDASSSLSSLGTTVQPQHLQHLQQQLQQHHHHHHQQQQHLLSAHSPFSLTEDSQELRSSGGSEKGSFPF